MSSFEIISLVFSGLNLLSIFFLVVQIVLSRKGESNHYEEQRRIMTINVMHQWSSGLKKEFKLAEKIVHGFNENKCKELYDYKPISVNEQTHDLLCQMCSLSNDTCTHCKKENNNYIISGVPLTELRGNVTNYLNALEIVATAWQQGIVDKEVLETQFSYLHTPGSKSALHNYRKVAGGGNSFPMLDKFYQQIESNHTLNVTPKKTQK